MRTTVAALLLLGACGSVTPMALGDAGPDASPAGDVAAAGSSGAAGTGAAGAPAVVDCYNAICGDGSTRRARDATCAPGPSGRACEACEVPSPLPCMTVENGPTRYLVHDCGACP